MSSVLSKEEKLKVKEEKRLLKEAEEKRKEDAKRNREIEREKAKAHYEWRRSLVFAKDVPGIMGITKAEYDRWFKDGKIKPSEWSEFRKWGKSLKAPLFDPLVLKAIPKKNIEKWRSKENTIKKENRIQGAKKASHKKIITSATKENLQTQFSRASALNRHIHLCLGPTNSGKTHQAMQALKNAKTGVYLAPLRLLALENYERLQAQGIKVSLITGEERFIDNQATHVCSTIEMVNMDTEYEVAIIDEIQMLGDACRGWAWTNALLGVSAKTVYVCGAESSKPALLAVLEKTQESHSEHKFKRKVPLKILQNATHKAFYPGDALITFSKRRVLGFAAYLQKQGYGVSVLYGDLPPEVRRSQMQKFANGEHDFVVSTDCIGMGVNLPIKRIIFCDNRKFDGKEMRELIPDEVHQIAGRAGRYGFNEDGFYGGIDFNVLSTIDRCMQKQPSEIDMPLQFFPSWRHIDDYMKHMKCSLIDAVKEFHRKPFGQTFVCVDLVAIKDKLEVLSEFQLKDKRAYELARLPWNSGRDTWFVKSFIRSWIKNKRYIPNTLMLYLDGKRGDELFDNLESCEEVARDLALYYSLSLNLYGDVMYEEELPKLRLELNKAMERLLLETFNDMDIDLFKNNRRKRRRNKYHDYEDDDELEYV